MQKAILALSLTFASLTASAQALIPFAGGNISGYQGGFDGHTAKSLAGVNAGLLIDLRASSSFSLQTGLQYSLTGGKYVNSYSSFGGIVTQPSEEIDKVHSIEVPVKLVLKMGDEDDAHFFINVGFQLVRNLAGTRTVNGTQFNTLDSTYTPYHTTEHMQFNGYGYPQFNLGLNAGAGYRFANGLEIYCFVEKGYWQQAGVSARYALKLPKHRRGPQRAKK